MYARVPTISCRSLAPATPHARQLRGDAEVEQHDAPFGRHEDVGRLDVAVQLAGRVERPHPFDELAQRRP